MQLGGRPASSLEEILQEDYGIKIFCDSFDGTALCVSGKFGKAILLNRDNVKWRRNFSLAHELFHLLVENVYQNSEKEEKHAQIFASSLLLPNGSLIALIDAKTREGKVPVRDLITIAQEFHVSTEALLWRLCNLQRMTPEHVKALIASGSIRAFEAIGARKNETPRDLPDRYIRLAYQAYGKGRIGTAKLAQFLETTSAELVADFEIWNSDVALDEEAEVAFA
jgi:Zn-dependent peptidase ImmA (M78 family)